jgi:hypothetical protein
MKGKCGVHLEYSFRKWILSIILLLSLLTICAPLSLQGKTTAIGGGIYYVTEGVHFEIYAYSSGSFFFSWTDPDGTEFNNIQDPTLYLTIGETYTFERSSTGNPLRLTTDRLPVEKVPSVAGPYYRRTTEDLDEIDAASLTPLTEFTADPSGVDGTLSGDIVVLNVTASIIGTLYYTSLVPGNSEMTGLLIVEDTSGSTAAVKKSLQRKIKRLKKALKRANKKKRKSKAGSLKRRVRALTRRLRSL